MIYLEHWGVIHRDLRAANVLVSAEESLKISDFGLLLDNQVKDGSLTRFWYLLTPLKF